MTTIECDNGSFKVIVCHVEPKTNGMCETTEWRTFVTNEERIEENTEIMMATKDYLIGDSDVVIIMTKEMYDDGDCWVWHSTYTRKDFE